MYLAVGIEDSCRKQKERMYNICFLFNSDDEMKIQFGKFKVSF